MQGNKWHALTKVVLPSSIPAIISNMKVNIGLCLVGVVIGEFLAARSGLGYLIIYSSQVFIWEGILIKCDIDNSKTSDSIPIWLHLYNSPNFSNPVCNAA